MILDTSLIERLDQRQVLKELDRVDSEGNLRQFIELGWNILEPGRSFVPGWHIDAICEHLEAVTNGEISRLLINIPPGCMKSLTTNVFWPAWEWGPRHRADLRYVCASYSEDLTIRDNRRCRNLIQSDWYQQLWGKNFRLVGDQNAKKKFETNQRGFKIATSVGGLGTGERGDRFIIDDPHNIIDGESDLKREAVLLWFTEVVPTRVNDPDKSVIIIIMQRVHDRDVSGCILARELGYVHLMLPMEFDPERRCTTSIGFTDPREQDGGLLWKERMSSRVVDRDKEIMGEYAVASQFQQRPAPRGGGMFKRNWFEVVDTTPETGQVVRAWDLAASETKRAAYTAGVKMRRAGDGHIYIEDVLRFRGTPGKVEKMLLTIAGIDGLGVKISLPQDPGQAGKAQKRYLSQLLMGYKLHFSPETGDKASRAEPFSAQAEAGNVKMVRGLWNEVYLGELTTFPFSAFKDQADASSRAFTELVPKRQVPVPGGPEVISTYG